MHAHFRRGELSPSFSRDVRPSYQDSGAGSRLVMCNRFQCKLRSANAGVGLSKHRRVEISHAHHESARPSLVNGCYESRRSRARLHHGRPSKARGDTRPWAYDTHQRHSERIQLAVLAKAIGAAICVLHFARQIAPGTFRCCVEPPWAGAPHVPCSSRSAIGERAHREDSSEAHLYGVAIAGALVARM